MTTGRAPTGDQPAGAHEGNNRSSSLNDLGHSTAAAAVSALDTPDSATFAASIAACGWPVIPLYPDTRRPIGSGGERHRRLWITDPAGVLEYAETHHERTWAWPSWGVVLGEPNAYGHHLVVLDTDSDEAEHRLVTLLDETEAGSTWAGRTLTVRTRRGRHRYGTTRLPARTCKPWGDDGGLDLKGRGGYVVGAGCPHPKGGRYRVEPGQQGTARTTGPQVPGCVYAGVDDSGAVPRVVWQFIAPVPGALTTVERRAERPTGGASGTDTATGGPLSPIVARHRIDGALRRLRSAPVGARDDTCNTITYVVAGLLGRVPAELRTSQLDPSHVRAELIEAAMSTGLARHEADKPHAWGAGWADPAGAAPDRPRPATDEGARR